ncbi:hypothetical protein JTB14_032875 [Gonioctena quinquepunctata]|nr:hypothetical protein JTB14_032875 [Gonioctena quinquepunctata]
MKKKKRKEWMTSEISEMIQERDKMRQNLLEIPNNERHEELYRLTRNRIMALTKRPKTAFFRYEIEQAQNNPKKLWHVVDELNSRKKHTDNRLDEIIAYGNILEDSHGIANAMNSHYVSVGKNLAKEIIQDSEYTPPQSRIISYSVFLYATDPIEVKGIILFLKNGESPRFDSVKAGTLKTIADRISIPLAHIFNKSMQQGIFPTPFKRTIVLP